MRTWRIFSPDPPGDAQHSPNTYAFFCSCSFVTTSLHIPLQSTLPIAHFPSPSERHTSNLPSPPLSLETVDSMDLRLERRGGGVESPWGRGRWQPFLLLLRLRRAQSTVARLWSPPETLLLRHAPSTHGGAKLSQPLRNDSPPPVVVSSSGERQCGGRADLLRAGWLRGSPPSSVQRREAVGNHGGVRQVNGKLPWPPKLRSSRPNRTFPRPIEPPLGQIEPTVEEVGS